MEPANTGDLLREARLRHGVTAEDLAIRAGTDRATVSAIEMGAVSPSVAILSGLLELLGEELVLAAESWSTGIDLTLNQANLELSPDQRVRKGLAFADFVRQTRPVTARGLGPPLRGSLDIVGHVPGIDGYEQLRRAATFKLIAGSEVPVASLNHLIAMKQASGQRKDLLMAMEYVELADEIRRREAEE